MITGYRNLTACLAAVAALVAVATLPNLAGTPTPWYVLLGGSGALGVWALVWLRREELLPQLAKPKSGDVTLGIISGLVLTGSAFFVLRTLALPTSPRSAWLFGLYSQFGDVQGEILLTAGLLAVVILEELVWRGVVQTHCVEMWGPRRGLVVGVALYGLAHLPALFTMQAPGAGLNPLLPVGAMACGLVWGVLVLLTGRLAPAVVCHAVASYFLAAPAPTWLW